MTLVAAHVAEALRLYVILTLAVAVLGKLRALDAFQRTVAELAQASAGMAQVGAGAVIAAEMACALALIWRPTAQAGAVAGAALFLGFGVVVALALVQRRAIPCNCFGDNDGHTLSAPDLTRSGLLATACLVQIVVPPAAPPGDAAYALSLAVAVLGSVATIKLHVPFRRLARPIPPASAALSPGDALPPFEGRAASDGRVVTATDLAGQATAILFLATGCPKCRAHIPQIRGLLPAARRAGLNMWVAPMEDGPSPLLAESELGDHILRLDRPTRERLNPERAAPHYLFVDHRGVVQACGLLGDADWRSFVDQMAELVAV